MMRRFSLVLLALCLSAPVLAAEVGGVKLDAKASVGGQELVLNGAGIRTKVFFKVYVASLYLPAKATDLAGVLATRAAPDPDERPARTSLPTSWSMRWSRG